MKPKMKIKMGIDVSMTVLLLLLMAYQITGQKLHEWFGAGMLVLFLLHNILNIRWYGNLFKGKYTLLRVTQVIINLSVLASMLCLGFSGIVMSRHVFAEYIAMMGLWIFVSFYAVKGIRRLTWPNDITKLNKKQRS